MDIKFTDKDLTTQKARGFINVKLNGVPQTTDQVTLYSFGDGKGGIIAGLGATPAGLTYTISLGYPARDKIKPIVHFPEDYSDPYSPWSFNWNSGAHYYADKGTLELTNENLPNSATGKFSFTTEGGTEVTGDFYLVAF